MKTYTLITGASSGIGHEMAKQLAVLEHNLILTARSEDVLKQTARDLSRDHGIDVRTYTADLSAAQGAEQLYRQVVSDGYQVDHLINNAGVGCYGKFIDLPLDDDLKMITLNTSSLVVLSKCFGREMASRGAGRILNVASLLSFLPLPYYSVYSATKAFVLAFSETMASELEGSGVAVTTLCPGPVDTAFTTEGMANTNAYKSNKPISPAIVAREGVKLLRTGKGKKIVGFQTWFVSNLPRFTPDVIMMKIKKQLASQRSA